MNKIILMGRITKDPELRQTQNNASVVSFTLAVTRRFDKDKADFIDCIAWKSTAEFVNKYFKKGQQVVVCGSLQTRTWQDKEGNNRKTYEVIADEVYFADVKDKRN